MIVRLLVRNVDPDDVDPMICAMERDFGVDVEYEDSYPEDGDEYEEDEEEEEDE